MKQTIRATFHDNINMTTGKLEEIEDLGCFFLSDETGSSPMFSRKSTLQLNLFDRDSGETMNVPVQMTGVARESGLWLYRVKWSSVPEMLQN